MNSRVGEGSGVLTYLHCSVVTVDVDVGEGSVGSHVLVNAHAVGVGATVGSHEGDLFVLEVEYHILLAHEGGAQDSLAAASIDAEALEAPPLVEVLAGEPLDGLVFDHEEERREGREELHLRQLHGPSVADLVVAHFLLLALAEGLRGVTEVGEGGG